VAAAAARQCGRADLPTVAAITPLAAALAAVSAPGRLLADPAGPPLSAAQPPAPAVAILVGPEGGLSDDERAAALAAGFAPVSLGPTILRAETAGLILAAALRLFAPGPGGRRISRHERTRAGHPRGRRAASPATAAADAPAAPPPGRAHRHRRGLRRRLGAG
jgi:hypothetical protein